jgi:hypothetical protein
MMVIKMTTQPDYSKIYTHAPEQHPNLILGSLELLFSMFFRPTAFKINIKDTLDLTHGGGFRLFRCGFNRRVKYNIRHPQFI